MGRHSAIAADLRWVMTLHDMTSGNESRESLSIPGFYFTDQDTRGHFHGRHRHRPRVSRLAITTATYRGRSTGHVRRVKSVLHDVARRAWDILPRHLVAVLTMVVLSYPLPFSREPSDVHGEHRYDHSDGDRVLYVSVKSGSPRVRCHDAATRSVG